MSIINFTVQHDHRATIQDADDAGDDADLLPLIGWVFFSPDSSDVFSAEYSPRPTAFKILRFAGYIGLDGRLRASKEGPLGVRLPANDPLFGLAKLTYQVNFDLRTPGGQPVPFTGGYFNAPSQDMTIWLAQALSGSSSPVAGEIIDGGFPDSSYAELIDGGIPNSNGSIINDGGVA